MPIRVDLNSVPVVVGSGYPAPSGTLLVACAWGVTSAGG
jgi:hypothetical protein